MRIGKLKIVGEKPGGKRGSTAAILDIPRLDTDPGYRSRMGSVNRSQQNVINVSVASIIGRTPVFEMLE